MRRFKSILAYVQDHPMVDTGLTRAIELARTNRASLTLMVVVGAERRGYRNVVTGALARLITTRETLTTYAERLKEEGLQVHVQASYGRPSREIIRQVISAGHDLVIKTARPEDDYERARFFGTTAIRLLRGCPCPVWVVRHERNRHRRVLAAIDAVGDPERRALSDEIMTRAASLAAMEDAELHVVQVWDVWGTRNHLLADEQRLSLVEHVRRRVSYDLTSYLDAYRRYLPVPDRIHSLQGTPVEQITELAISIRADTVVMGTFARSGVRSYLIGNTAEKILPYLDASALVIKPAHFAAQMPDKPAVDRAYQAELDAMGR
ncbi:MAG: universal stress protein [Haliangiales bacterium]